MSSRHRSAGSSPLPSQRATRSAPSFLTDLNPEQRRAVTTTDGPLLILAGAGSGKTKTLTHRIAYLLLARGVAAERILAVTFTNKAAQEMRERLQRLIGTRGALPTMGTFHSFCAKLLRTQGQLIGLPPQYTIYDADEAASVMKSVMTEAHIPPKTLAPNAILHTIGRWKDELRTNAEARAAARDLWEERIADLWDRYDKRLAEHQAIDFDGLLYESVRLLRTHESLRSTLEERYRFISVDEYQDTNRSQAELLRLLTGTTKNLCVVGDDAQAIYGWRGAHIANIREFPKQFPGCTVVTLEQNYRSTQAILEAANQVITRSAEGMPKTLWTKNAQGNPPRLLRALDERSEGRLILRSFQRLFASTSYGPGDAAILYRTNAQSRALEEACLATGTPYDIVGGLTFYERKEVKDIIAYLRFLQNPRDALAFRRMANVPTRGIGERTIESCLLLARDRDGDPLHPEILQTFPDSRRQGLEGFAHLIGTIRAQMGTLSPVEILDMLLRDLKFRSWLQDEERRTRGAADPTESRYENVLELRTVAERHTTLEDFLAELSLMSDVEKSTQREGPRVKLMTIHAAKGLEFPIVAIAGMEEGLLPHQNALESVQGIEEERRLCYVAMTRAQQFLFLSYARSRTMYGSRIETTRSQFLDDVASYEGDSEDNLFREEASFSVDHEPTISSEDFTPFVIGESIVHTHFGAGTIEHVRGSILTVRFSMGVKKLDATQAPITKTLSEDTDAI